MPKVQGKPQKALVMQFSTFLFNTLLYPFLNEEVLCEKLCILTSISEQLISSSYIYIYIYLFVLLFSTPPQSDTSSPDDSSIHTTGAVVCKPPTPPLGASPPISPPVHKGSPDEVKKRGSYFLRDNHFYLAE